MIVVEDGSIVSGANSYVTIVEIKEYCASRGFDLPVLDADIEKVSSRAIDYLESKRSLFQGKKASSLQQLQFPRIGVYVDNFALLSTEIPKLLKDAQCALCHHIFNDRSPMTPIESAIVTEEVIGPLKIKYSGSYGADTGFFLKDVDSLLTPLYKNTGAGLTVSRS